MENDYKSASDQISKPASADHNKAKTNVGQLSAMLEAEETPATHSDETAEKLQSTGAKTMIAAAAIAGVMGITGMMHPEKAGDVTPPTETVSVVEMLDNRQPVVEQEQKDPVEIRKMPFVTSQVEFTERSWWHNVPAISQQDLTYDGRETDFGCAPTAVSMVTEYWHQQDPDNQTSSAQELLDKNVEQGIFEGRGMSVTNIHDELAALGYEAKDYSNANLETLKQEVAKGPVVAAVKLGMSTNMTEHNHSVVVTGISENNEVRINDPWTGESRTYSWNTFNASWGTLGRWIMTVRPT
ncbi:MAG TPA: C39 family peptidase [Anaerolineae bacterium]|nr:C39 family peptidase [Anaerolineae bacterium]HQH36925.1 C39 family peptidase [Anaerolineae bacterium]